jgi:hypothetical protein
MTASQGDTTSKLKKSLKNLRKSLNEVFYGATVYELEVALRKDRGALDKLFMLVIFGDFVGLPILPPYHSMRLLPYIVPRLETWKRNLAREKDLTDGVSLDI